MIDKKITRAGEINMKKKLLSLISVTVLVLSMGLSVAAADSVDVNGVITGVGGATDKNGNAVEASVSAVASEYQAAVAEVKTADKLKELLGDAYLDTMSVVGVYDVSVPEGTEFPVTITFNVSGVTANTKVAVLHYDTEKGAWEKVEATAGAGTITATFTSLSPVAFVVDEATSTGTTAAATTASGKSPKTNGTTIALVLAIIALAAAGSVTYLVKKKNVQA